MKSSARLTSSHLVVEPLGWARLLAPFPRRLTIPIGSVHEKFGATAEDVGAMLGWKIIGTATSRRRAMGWFSLARRHGARGERAWVWITPGRDVRVFAVDQRRPRIVAVPADWFSVTPD